MSKITGVHHIAIRAADFDRSVRFYTEALGLQQKASWTSAGKRATLIEIVPGSRSYIEIFERNGPEIVGEPPILHFSLRTDDCDGMVERARAFGVKITVESVDVKLDTSIGPVDLRLAFIEGPDREIIELFTSELF